VSGHEPAHGKARAARVAYVEHLLAAVGTRAEIAARLESPAVDRLLQSIVAATVELFDAEAASIALVEPDGTLRFRVAAGPRGQGVVGLTVGTGEGIVGYVRQTGQPLALSDVASDPRFERDTAARTGYLPRSILAVPLELGDRVIGVLEVLDKRDSATFGLDDLARAGVFARQAATAIDVATTDRSVARLLAEGLAAIAGDGGDVDDPRVVDALVSEALARLGDAEPSFWNLVDRLAALRTADPGRLNLLADMLDVAVAHQPATRDVRPTGRSWRDRIDPADTEP
jgi:GAF domain-containing protein